MRAERRRERRGRRLPPLAWGLPRSYRRPLAASSCRAPLTLAAGSSRKALVGTTPNTDVLTFIAEGTAGAVGEEFFQRLVEHLALAFEADVGFAAELVPEDCRRARFLACWRSGGLDEEPSEYELAGTPCGEIAGADVVFYSDGVMERFPEDEMVKALGLDSYLGVALRSSEGAHLGQLGVLAAGPLLPSDRNVAVIKIFAARAAAELERRQHEHALRESEVRQRALAEEQAALRRVATLVAADATEPEVLDSVATEVGQLLGADIASLVRYEGEHVEILAGWSHSPSLAVPTGLVVRVNEATATRKALLTGRPARADDLDTNVIAQAIYEGQKRRHREGHKGDVLIGSASAAQVVRELGIRSAVAAPIKVGGAIWGAVTAARTRGEIFPPEAEKRLGDFAELVAQSIANSRAQGELAASRARIVQAGDDARRRLERDLHDGAQQRFVAATLALRLVRARVDEDAADAGRMLDQVHGELQLALNELRDLAQGIHPAVLSERGLGAAIESLALQASVPVAVAEAPSGRLPPPVEVAGYFVVAEALTNVAKYSGATAATVRAATADGALVVEVSDDGVGGADPAQGSGLRGLLDRLDALGGGLRIDSPPGRGTRLVATIPLETAPPG